MFCRKCGSENPDGSQKCASCGELFAPPAAAAAAIPQAEVPSYLVWSIITTAFCCPYLGIVALIYSAQVPERQKYGDIAGAKEASKKAKMWLLIGIGASLLFWVIYLAFIGFAMFGALSNLGQNR